MRTGVAALATFVWLAPLAAQAQTVSTSRPSVTWIGLGRRGDASGGAGDVDRMGELALEPLRLSLLGTQPLVPTGGCGDAFAEAKSGASSLSAMRAFGSNLLGGGSPSWSTPPLSLFGFSRIGCPLDSAFGGVATFTLPIRSNIALTLSAGMLYVPKTPADTARSESSARAGVVIRRANGSSFNVGVDTFLHRVGVSVGGVF